MSFTHVLAVLVLASSFMASSFMASSFMVGRAAAQDDAGAIGGAAAEVSSDGDAAAPAGGEVAGSGAQAVMTDDQAHEHFARGRRAYDDGQYDTAIEEWQRAFELDPRPRIQFNLSQAYERLGRLTDAAAALDRFLQDATPDDPYQASAVARRAALRERLGRTGIRITNAPEGAVILVDDHDWGRTPRPDAIPVDPGPHDVVLRLEGFHDFHASVVLAPGQAVEVGGALEALPPPSREAGSSWPLILMVAGGAFGVGASVAGLTAIGKAKDAPTRDSTLAASARTLARVADTLWVVGLLSAGAGLLWWLLEDDGPPEQAAGAGVALRLAPVLTPAAAGALVEGRF